MKMAKKANVHVNPPAPKTTVQKVVQKGTKIKGTKQGLTPKNNMGQAC